jgi:hypothetical protein
MNTCKRQNDLIDIDIGIDIDISHSINPQIRTISRIQNMSRAIHYAKL